jgi:hypothetical protein
MTLAIELTPDEEARLQAAAREQGLDPTDCARRLLIEHLPPLRADSAQASERDRTLELFEQWEAEDATDDPEEIARRNQEWEELKAQMNATRAELGAEPLFP